MGWGPKELAFLTNSQVLLMHTLSIRGPHFENHQGVLAMLCLKECQMLDKSIRLLFWTVNNVQKVGSMALGTENPVDIQASMGKREYDEA